MGGAVSWPALSESTRPVMRSSSDSSIPFSGGSASSSQAPIISHPAQRQANTNSHANPTANNTTRPRSRNRGGSGSGGGGSSLGSGPSHNTLSRPPPRMPPPFPVYEVHYGMVPPMLDTSVTGTRTVGGVGGSHSQMGNGHSSQRNNSRRGNYGLRPRGDGPYHNNNGGRRNQDRRDSHHRPPQYMPPPMGYMPPPFPPGAPPFMAPPHVRLYPGQMGFDMASPFIYVPTMPPESYRAMPIVSPPPPPPMPLSPANENPLMNMIIKQIDYYFSDDNLAKDNFLRSKMDDHGWVPITLIASFPRVQQLTNDIPVILESLQYSDTVEVQGDKVRRRNEWNKWNKWLNPASWMNSHSGPRTLVTARENVVAASLQELSLDGSTTNANDSMGTQKGHPEISTGAHLSEGSTGQSNLGNGEDIAEESHTFNI